MPKQKPSGPCHLCGHVGPLSFEHVPPRSAFNDQRVVLHQGEHVIGLGPGERAKEPGKILQQGRGAYTLCPKCNNKTGRWYGSRFAAWCHQGMESLAAAGGTPSLVQLHYMFPLAILKQIATMFFSVNSNGFCDAHPELQQFVLDKEKTGLSNSYRFFVYYFGGGRLRSAGVVGRMNVEAGELLTFSELVFPPFGYVLTFGQDAPDSRLAEISHFADFKFESFQVGQVRLPVLETHLILPGDYRTLAEIQRDYDENTKGDRAL